jgi:hypothetical protein
MVSGWLDWGRVRLWKFSQKFTTGEVSLPRRVAVGINMPLKVLAIPASHNLLAAPKSVLAFEPVL